MCKIWSENEIEKKREDERELTSGTGKDSGKERMFFLNFLFIALVWFPGFGD